MMYEAVARAYDAIADEYERQVAGDGWMRRQLWQRYRACFRPGDRVLDVGCGTGLDSLFLAQQGLSVTAIDVSAEMIAQLNAEAGRDGVSDRVEAVVMDATALGVLPADRYDGIISAFAGLNTVPDLAAFAAAAARVLRPDGRLIVHMLNRVSLWEWLGLVLRRQWSAARGLHRQRERTFTIGGISLRHRMYHADDAYRCFVDHFRLDRVYGLGILRPPHTVRRLPASIVAALGALEQHINGYRPFRNLGRFFVLEMTKC